MNTDNKQPLIIQPKTKAERILEFKDLLDKGIITQEEFEKEAKILNEN